MWETEDITLEWWWSYLIVSYSTPGCSNMNLSGIQLRIKKLAITNNILGGDDFWENESISLIKEADSITKFFQKLLMPAFFNSSPSWKTIKANTLKSVPISKQYLEIQMGLTLSLNISPDDVLLLNLCVRLDSPH